MSNLCVKHETKILDLCIQHFSKHPTGMIFHHTYCLNNETIVTKFPGRTGRGTGSRIEGRDFVKLWYEGVYPFGTRTRILVRESVANGSMTLGRS